MIAMPGSARNNSSGAPGLLRRDRRRPPAGLGRWSCRSPRLPVLSYEQAELFDKLPVPIHRFLDERDPVGLVAPKMDLSVPGEPTHDVVELGQHLADRALGSSVPCSVASGCQASVLESYLFFGRGRCVLEGSSDERYKRSNVAGHVHLRRAGNGCYSGRRQGNGNSRKDGREGEENEVGFPKNLVWGAAAAAHQIEGAAFKDGRAMLERLGW